MTLIHRMYNATAAAAAAQYSSNYCMYNMTNATNTSQVVCVVDDHPYLPKYSMDVSIFSYMYTLFLAFGCYSALNPVSARSFAIKTIFNLANYTITGYSFFKDRVYRPYMKRVHPKLLRLLNIDDGINEIIVIKNGKVIHSFKTMELFVKNNPIKFVKEFSDEDSEQEEQARDQDQEHENRPDTDPNADTSDYVDYNKKCEQLTELIEAFKAHSLDDAVAPAPAPETSEVQRPTESAETSESDETDKTSDGIPDDYILDPTEYDFIIRNFYYDDAKTGETHSYVFKYDIFYKSEMVEKYDIQMIKDNYFSTRKFIGISLKTNNQKYNINLTSPSNYYLSDNSILNYSFLKWYMMKHHGVKLSHDYVISGIDNYVEMYIINPGKKIIVHKNKFQIVDDETFNGDNDNDNDADTHANVDAGLDTDTDTDADTPAADTQNENNKEPRLLFNNNLEENHEMFDIEILDYE